MANVDVSRQFIRDTARPAANLSLEQVRRMRIHDVDPAYIRGMAAGGYRRLEAGRTGAAAYITI